MGELFDNALTLGDEVRVVEATERNHSETTILDLIDLVGCELGGVLTKVQRVESENRIRLLAYEE